MGADHDDLNGEIINAFNIFDVDSSGRIGREGIKYALELMGENYSKDAITKILKLFGKDKNEFIFFDEFMKFFF